MPGLAQRNHEQFSNNAQSVSSANGFWSKHSDDVCYNQLQKFWSGLSPQRRQVLLRIDKQTLFEQARKNMYCSRCNGLLLEVFLQIVMYGKSLQQDGAVGQLPFNRSVASKNQNDSGSIVMNGYLDDIQDPSVHPWGGLTTTRDGSLTLLDCYLYSKSLKVLQNVFDSARARERERELLYPDACGGGGRGWISQGMTGFGRGHGTRETCALHTARLSCATLADFWSALGEETRQSLLRMKEEDFIERLMYRFDSKRFCRDCRRNVIREFKELKELKRMRREPRCTSWFCVADTTFQYEVSDDTVQADWRQTFADTVGTYHHFEWAVGTGEGKSDILEFENVGMNGSVQVSGLDLSVLSACFITLRAWKLDGRCTELTVKAHALKGQQCVHCRLVVGDGYVKITRGESIRKFFEHAEEAEEEEDDDSMDKDGNELDGECSRPQKHAKSPELAREFLLDAATIIFKEQVEKAFREGTARQNAHSIFVCLTLKLLEESVHVACKEIITLEKQSKLLEEEEREKREEEERKVRRRMKEREKKLRRKERLKGKERDKEKKSSSSDPSSVVPGVLKEESSASVDKGPINAISSRDTLSDTGDIIMSWLGSPDIQDEQFSGGCMTLTMENCCYDSPDGEVTSVKDENGTFQMEQSKFSRRRSRLRKEVQLDSPLKWSDRRRCAVVSDNGSTVYRSEYRYHSDNYESPSRDINGSNRQLWTNTSKSSVRSCSGKFNEKMHCSNNKMSDRYGFHSCSCNPQNEYRAKAEPHVSTTRVGRDPKSVSKSESTLDMSKQFCRGSKYNQMDYVRDGSGRPKSKVIMGNNPCSRDSLHSKKVWEPMECQKKCPRSNSDSDVTLRSTTLKSEGIECGNNIVESSGEMHSSGAGGNSCDMDHEDDNMKKSRDSNHSTDETCQIGCHTQAKDSFYSMEAAYQETVLCHSRNSTLNRISDAIAGSTSNSDNCSSCLSEGDSNTVSSNHGNMELSSTSDSEDASQQSEGRDSSSCTQNGFSECHEVGMEKTQSTNRGETLGSRAMGSNIPGNLSTKTAQIPEKGLPTINTGSQHQGIFPPLHNQNVQFPAFQPPSTMGYYHQNPVSWSAAPANGLMPFTPPNHYLYAGSLGYGLNGNSHLCMQYGALQHVTPPLYDPSSVPVYQSVANTNDTREQTHIGKPDSNSERVAPTRPHVTDTQGRGEGGHTNNSSAKLPTDNSGFSLFHFGGPVALSAGCKLNPMPSKVEIVGNFSSQFSADHAENDHACNKKETTIEEYNLFAGSNGPRFSFF